MVKCVVAGNEIIIDRYAERIYKNGNVQRKSLVLSIENQNYTLDEYNNIFKIGETPISVIKDEEEVVSGTYDIVNINIDKILSVDEDDMVRFEINLSYA